MTLMVANKCLSTTIGVRRVVPGVVGMVKFRDWSAIRIDESELGCAVISNTTLHTPLIVSVYVAVHAEFIKPLFKKNFNFIWSRWNYPSEISLG